MLSAFPAFPAFLLTIRNIKWKWYSYILKKINFFLIFKMKSTGSDMYDENIHYPRLIILTKAGWRSVVITVNNANLWYYVFQILAAYPNKCNVDYSSFYHWNKICFVWVVWVKIFSSPDWRDTRAYLTWPCSCESAIWTFHSFIRSSRIIKKTSVS